MRFYYNSDFEGILTRFPKVFNGEYWPHGLFISKGGNMVWVNEYPELRQCGRSVFLHYMFDKSGRQKVWNGWLRDLGALKKWESKFDSIKGLSALSEKSFIVLWSEMREILLNFWTNILVPEMGNYGGDGMLEEELGNYIKNENEVSQVLEILTSPEEPSFFKQEEMDLVKADDLSEHSRKYFWLRNSYNGTEVLSTGFFEDRKKSLDLEIEYKFKKRQDKIRKKKLEIKAKYSLSDYVMEIADAFVRGIEWQDSRKQVIWVYLHYKSLMIEEASRRLNIPKRDLENYGTGEILEMLSGKLPKQNEIEDRRKAFVVVMDVFKKPVICDSKTALKYWDLYAEDKVERDVKGIMGIVVSAGKNIKGRVHILLNPKESDIFKTGDILVAPMTTPEYIFAMKKASAVITDTGGLMSHAAIVSRELGIPCVVGTKIATKVLKDGDLVEVDANNGVVKIIRRQTEKN